MKLYACPHTCSLGPHIALHELGLEHELVLIDLQAGEGQTPEHLKRNPLGMVPVLELDDGALLTECSAILQYLADRKPEAGLAPARDSFERYRLQEWLSLISTEFHKSFYPLFFGSKILPDDDPRRTMQAFFRERLRKRWQVASDRLGDGPWLMGERYTVADIYLYVIMTWWEVLRQSLDDWPNLAALRDRIASRPAVRSARAAEASEHAEK